jgi:DNA mismatch repair protein MutS2
MIEHSLRVLEYYRLLDILSRYAASPLGRSDCLSLKPSKELDSVNAEQRLVSEMKQLLLIKGFISLSSLVDLKPVLRKACKKGACLDPKELLSINTLLKISHQVKNWVHDSKEMCPSLTDITDSIPECPKLANEIGKSITEDGEISDDASPLLSSLRSQRVALRRAVEKKLYDLLNSLEFGDDTIMSVRDGRYVISARTEKRDRIKGIVHGYSGSHSTCYMEPLAVVEENNHLIELIDREKEEERKVLKKLTELVSDFSSEVLTCLEIMGRIDGLFARAHFSKAINGITPILDNERIVYLSDALNPILLFLYLESEKSSKNGNAERVVPIGVTLDDEKNTLIISGPNRGGKTVALKTIGLLALMAQSGMHIPVGEGSRLGIFDDILAEIGDEQDISTGLSTFSARMENLKEIVNRADENSLVIIDELGAGTDPDEGTALAMAILDNLSEKGCLSLISTHYQKLKKYGLINKKAQNASVEFDYETGRPTFRLLTGMPGVSHAIEVAKHIGISLEIISKASAYLGKERDRSNSIMKELAHLVEDVREEKKAVTIARQDYELAKKGVEEERETSRCLVSELLTEKQHKAERLIRDARREFSKAIAYLKEQGSSGQVEATQRYTQVKKDLTEAIAEMRETKNSDYHEHITVGQTVLHTELKKRGRVVGIDKSSSKVHIMLGKMKLTVDIAEIIPDSEILSPQKDNKKEAKNWSVSSPPFGMRELNLIGYTVDEALPLVDQMIDKALVHGYTKLTIVHGIGSGTLKRAIREHLKENSYVKDFISGGKEGANDGITIVEL